MPSTLLRLAVALLTFGLGVTATTFWIAYRTPDVHYMNEQFPPHKVSTIAPLIKTDEGKIPPSAPKDKCGKIVEGMVGSNVWGDLAKCLHESHGSKHHRCALTASH